MLLIPIKTEMERVAESQDEIVQRFNSQVQKHNVGSCLNKQNDLSRQKFRETDALMETIRKTQRSKELLKAQFLYILDSYIKSRDAFGMMTPGREKEELIAATKAQVNLL
jgi:hypothetical protein